ncbi:hypothetical protein [Bacillus phage CP-51]|uniref:Uncharacterized protein n=1 Tax=Bacillus phage CP-51 TaxID=1391188 RepID=A0A068EMX4_9CAUD|nr:hypothetical protein OZ73_gp165 [Bacillus phage CP-51]AID50600.1 hypothetical protein [Bacillus phage CP-51]
MSQPYQEVPAVVQEWLVNEVRGNIEQHNELMSNIEEPKVVYIDSDIYSIVDNILSSLHESVITPNVNNRFDIEEDC